MLGGSSVSIQTACGLVLMGNVFSFAVVRVWSQTCSLAWVYFQAADEKLKVFSLMKRHKYNILGVKSENTYKQLFLGEIRVKQISHVMHQKTIMAKVFKEVGSHCLLFFSVVFLCCSQCLVCWQRLGASFQ